VTVDDLIAEFGGQREMMAHFAKINYDDIKGMRLPLFELSGNTSFEAMLKVGLEYDSSWPTQHFISPGLWPYSLEYQSIQDCPIGVYIHAAWFLKGENYFEAYMKAGKPFDKCEPLRTPSCVPKLCQLVKQTTREERWMTSCSPCPAVYPWLGNPLGQNM
ncbi:chitin deacetylase 7-like, partial [Bradysia coprophila]|uniref:chitin deacetylase 7-like n=1 Tax=Bradysia coprophila TaxID=38358 RepID=UPI00187D73A8